MDGTEAASDPGAEGVRWLTTEERRAWLCLVATHMQLRPALEADLQQRGGVSIFEYQVMTMLSESAEPLAMSELAARTDSSLSRLSHAVRKIEVRGWIQRSTSLQDARVTLAELTAQGREEIVRLAPIHVASVRTLFLDLLDQQDLQDMVRIGGKIVKHLKPDHWVFRNPEITGEEAADAP